MEQNSVKLEQEVVKEMWGKPQLDVHNISESTLGGAVEDSNDRLTTFS